MKLVRGRCNSSHLLLANSRLHLFVWTPFHGADSWGATLRVRLVKNAGSITG